MSQVPCSVVQAEAFPNEAGASVVPQGVEAFVTDAGTAAYNAVVESFFACSKREETDGADYASRHVAQQRILSFWRFGTTANAATPRLVISAQWNLKPSILPSSWPPLNLKCAKPVQPHQESGSENENAAP